MVVQIRCEAVLTYTFALEGLPYQCRAPDHTILSIGSQQQKTVYRFIDSRGQRNDVTRHMEEGRISASLLLVLWGHWDWNCT